MSKAIKTYQQLPPNVKQAINNTAAKAARAVVSQVKSEVSRRRATQTRSKTTRTRNGMRIYTPNDVVETRAFAPVSYATSWTSGNKSLRVHQTEVIGRISSNSTWFPSWNPDYSVATFPINPANPTTFPWLSYIARLYDKYRFHSLKFIYVNSVSTQREGNVMMSLDYDTLDAAPKNIVEASQLARYKLTPIYYPAEFPIPVNHPGNNPWLYTFDLSATQSTVDLKTYNLGNFFLALDGVPQDGKDYGYLAVEYDVELLDKNPVVSDTVFSSATYDSSTPPTKRNRSNVDPADTMNVMVEVSDFAADEKMISITFSDNVPVGAKARLGLNVNTSVSTNNSTGVSASLDGREYSDGLVLLDGYFPLYFIRNNFTTDAAAYFNFDVTVPQDRTLTFHLNTGLDAVTFTPQSPTITACVSYTYA